MKKIESLDVRGKRVLCRVDFNVPLHDGKVGDLLRIESALPTIRYLLKESATVILMSHLGRPDGKPNLKYSLEPIAIELSRLLDRKVVFIHDCVGDEVEARVAKLESGSLALLENLRFHPEEEANDKGFAKQLARLGDVYVDDAFAVAHRAHASLTTLAQLLPHAAGFLMQAEIDTIDGLLEHPKHPFVAVIGGAKITDKIPFLNNLVKKADSIVIGGAMANTFLAALGHDMRKSVQEKSAHKQALKFLAEARHLGVEVILPVDVVVADKPEANHATRVVTVGQLEGDDMALDLGPASSTLIAEALHGAKTIFWNGTLGFTEIAAFARSSHDLAKRIAKTDALTVIGGGDTAGYIDSIGMHKDFGFVSTGGGATLELLAGKQLPAVEALTK